MPITNLQKLEVIHLLIIHSERYGVIVDMPATPNINAVTDAILKDYERLAVASGELTQEQLDGLYAGTPLPDTEE